MSDTSTMHVEITEADCAAVKEKVLANVESKLTEEVLASMRRTVVFEVTRGVAVKSRERLENMLAEGIADAAIREEVARVLCGMAKENHSGQSEMHHIIERALFRIIDSRADAIGTGIVELLSAAMKKKE